MELEWVNAIEQSCLHLRFTANRFLVDDISCKYKILFFDSLVNHHHLDKNKNKIELDCVWLLKYIRC